MENCQRELAIKDYLKAVDYKFEVDAACFQYR